MLINRSSEPDIVESLRPEISIISFKLCMDEPLLSKAEFDS